MASSRYTFTLDLHSTYSQITLPVTAGDTDRELAISFADGDRPYTFEANDIVTVALKYPETGATAMYATEISDDLTYCVFELSQKYSNENGEEAYGSLCPVAGVYDAEVHIFRGGKKIASPYFSLEAAGGLVAGGEIPPADRDELAAIYAAEADRRTAETNRENAEKARANAETARNTAEETRNELYNEVKSAYESGKLKGEKGDKGDKGGQGDKGDPGEGFKISKTYPSIKAMEGGASSDGVPVHGFVIIETGNVEDVDNAKLFIKGEDGKYTYLTDLSGSQGFKGDDGDSIYVTDTIYTEKDDAYNIIKLSDGTELRIKNGRTGAPVAIIGVDESDASGGTNTVTFSNGVTLSIKNGKDGSGIADIQKVGSSGLVDTYRITLDDGATKYYTVTNGKDGIDGTSVYVASVNSTDAGTTVVFSDGTTIYIANGTNGKTAYQYAKEQGFSGTEEAFAIKLAQPVPSKTSDLSNDSGYVTGSAITTHNVSEASHSDIRLLLQGLADRINAIANSTDVDLDDFKEVVAYIKANRGLIDAITTNKINYTDIINDLVTNVTNKPLSAAQGVALKLLIDNLTNSKLDASALTSAINTALAQAKASGEFKGEDGKTPYIENGYWYINGASTGVKAQGNDGKGISSVAKTSTSGLVDTYTITFTDGTKTTYTVTNGAAGTSVTVSSVSESTESGGTNVVAFSDGKKVNIKNGKDGKDYVLTDDDKDEIVTDVSVLLTAEVEAEVENQLDGAKTGIVAEILAQIGGYPVFGTVDENKIITTTTRLVNGTYVLRYKDENNTYSELAEFTVTGGDSGGTAVEIKNWLDEVGYTVGKRISLSDGSIKDASTRSLTGCIPCKLGQTVRIQNIDVTENDTITISPCDTNKNTIKGASTKYGTTLYSAFVTKGTAEANGVYACTITSGVHACFDENMEYIRIVSSSFTDESVITVDQEII